MSFCLLLRLSMSANSHLLWDPQRLRAPPMGFYPHWNSKLLRGVLPKIIDPTTTYTYTIYTYTYMASLELQWVEPPLEVL